MPTLLSPDQATLLKDEKSFLADLQTTLAQVKSPPEDLNEARQALAQLDELFLIVVVGEFNAGKSALINALLGQRVLREGVTPTTSQVTLVKYGDKVEEANGAEGLSIVTFPLDLLQELNIVDTPGTNAIIRRHEELTRHFIPRSDLVLFVTSADRPFTESERQFLEHIREWQKKVIFVLNKRDILESAEALEQVTTFVTENARKLLGDKPELFAVSAKRAQGGDEAGSGMAEFRAFVTSWLDETARLRVKFASPLGVAEQLLHRAEVRAAHEREQLASDSETAERVEREIVTFEQEVKGELEPRLTEIDNLLLRLEARGLDFFDNKFRLTNLMDLARGDRFRNMFERQVLAGVPEEIEHRVQAAVNWLVEKDLHQWQQVVLFLQRRRVATPDQMVGEVTTSFEMRRQALLDSVTESAQTVVASYDAEKEARDVANSVESSVMQVALVEAGAVGLGTAITILVSSSALDVTGILFAGVVAVVGFFIIPYKREQAKTRFKEKVETLRQNLVRVLTSQFKAEADRSLARLKESVAPYTRFVRGEKDRLDQVDLACKGARGRLEMLQSRLAVVLGKG